MVNNLLKTTEQLNGKVQFVTHIANARLYANISQRVLDQQLSLCSYQLGLVCKSLGSGRASKIGQVFSLQDLPQALLNFKRRIHNIYHFPYGIFSSKEISWDIVKLQIWECTGQICFQRKYLSWLQRNDTIQGMKASITQPLVQQ